MGETYTDAQLQRAADMSAELIERLKLCVAGLDSAGRLVLGERAIADIIATLASKEEEIKRLKYRLRSAERTADAAEASVCPMAEADPHRVCGLAAALEEACASQRAALIAARDFASDEVENRTCAGGSMSDYINEAQEVLDACDAALSSLGVSRGGESP